MTDIESKIRSIISDKLGIAEDKITPDANFIEDLGADSLDSVELVMALEEELGIEIPDATADKLHCFRDVLDFATAKQLQ